jgi:formylglycine-generating enzyme required for sulfatase activity
MIAKLVSIALLLLLPALTEAQPVARCSRPLSEAQLTELVKGSVPAPVIEQNVAKCGIAFEPTGAAIGRLRSAGMPQTVLDAVRAATGPADRARQAELASWQSIKDSRDPGLFERFLKEHPASQYAGAARQKLAALKPAPPPPPATIAPGTKKVNPKDGLTYVWIPPGTFQMGCSPGDTGCDGDEKPVHRVTLTKGFWLGQTPVTQQAYERVTGQNPSHFKGADLPVETVNWDEAKAYCVAIGGRLPTEAEWEYAARAGSTGARYGNLDEIAWYSGNSGSQTHEVGRKSPNAFGLFDMLGNVWQWTANWYGDYQPSAQSDPSGAASGWYRALRGGSWYDILRDARVSSRDRGEPGIRNYNIGLRCVGE